MTVVNQTLEFGHGIGLDVDPQVSAIRAIGRIGPGIPKSIPALIAALKYRPAALPDATQDPLTRPEYSTAAAAARVLG